MITENDRLYFPKQYKKMSVSELKSEKEKVSAEIQGFRTEVINGTGISEQVINEIILLAQKYSVEKVILFGSRARGDYQRASDIDLAVSGGDVTGFALDVEEKTSTLLMYDVIDMSRNLQKDFRESIEKEGKILYEKI